MGDAATGHERDVFIDALRVLAVLVVVAAHFMTTTVIWEEGRIAAENALSVVPETHLSTWLLQVMPLLFFLSPVLYPPEVLASANPWLVTINPIAAHITTLRSLLFEGALPASESLMAVFLWTLVWISTGTLLYRASRSTVQDLV